MEPAMSFMNQITFSCNYFSEELKCENHVKKPEANESFYFITLILPNL